jgi:hypothetical protein
VPQAHDRSRRQLVIAVAFGIIYLCPFSLLCAPNSGHSRIGYCTVSGSVEEGVKVDDQRNSQGPPDGGDVVPNIVWLRLVVHWRPVGEAVGGWGRRADVPCPWLWYLPSPETD